LKLIIIIFWGKMVFIRSVKLNLFREVFECSDIYGAMTDWQPL